MCAGNPKLLGPALPNAHDDVISTRKLNVILRSNASSTDYFHVCDIVHIYILSGTEKHCRWMSAKQILAINSDAGFVIVPCHFGRIVNDKFEDIRTATFVSDRTEPIQSAIDDIDRFVTDTLDDNEYDVSDLFDVEDITENLAVKDLYGSEEALSSLSCRIQVYWPDDGAYYAGRVVEIDDNSKVSIHYNEKNVEHRLNKKNESGRLRLLPQIQFCSG